MQQISTHTLANLFSAKAQLMDLEELTNPIAPENLAARLAKAEAEVEAMNLADVAIESLNRAINKHAGTELFAAAMVIAWAPNELEGLKRVAEYYHRADLIETL